MLNRHARRRDSQNWRHLEERSACATNAPLIFVALLRESRHND